MAIFNCYVSSPEGSLSTSVFFRCHQIDSEEKTCPGSYRWWIHNINYSIINVPGVHVFLSFLDCYNQQKKVNARMMWGQIEYSLFLVNRVSFAQLTLVSDCSNFAQQLWWNCFSHGENIMFNRLKSIWDCQHIVSHSCHAWVWCSSTFLAFVSSRSIRSKAIEHQQKWTYFRQVFEIDPLFFPIRFFGCANLLAAWTVSSVFCSHFSVKH